MKMWYKILVPWYGGWTSLFFYCSFGDVFSEWRSVFSKRTVISLEGGRILKVVYWGGNNQNKF